MASYMHAAPLMAWRRFPQTLTDPILARKYEYESTPKELRTPSLCLCVFTVVAGGRTPPHAMGSGKLAPRA